MKKKNCVSKFPNPPEWKDNPGNKNPDYGYWVTTVVCEDCDWSHRFQWFSRDKDNPGTIQDWRKNAARYFRHHVIDAEDKKADYKMKLVGVVERPRSTHEYWIANIYGEWPKMSSRWDRDYAADRHLDWGGSGKNWFVILKNTQGFRVEHSRFVTYEEAYSKAISDLSKIEARNPHYNVIVKEQLETVEVEAPIANVTAYVDTLANRIDHTNNLERLMKIDEDITEFLDAAEMLKAARTKLQEKLLGI